MKFLSKTFVFLTLISQPQAKGEVWQIGMGKSSCSTVDSGSRVAMAKGLGKENSDILASQAFYFVWEVYKGVVASQKRPTVFNKKLLQDFLYYGSQYPRHRMRFFISSNKLGKVNGVLMAYDGRPGHPLDGVMPDPSGGKFLLSSIPLERKAPELSGKLQENKIEFFQLATRESADVDRLKIADELVREAVSYYATNSEGKTSRKLEDTFLYVHADRPTSILYPRRYGVKRLYGPKELGREGEYVLGGQSLREIYDSLRETLQ
ncbi:hypothetical protein N9D31_02495 [Oligoflexaceae bacterium]|nr:hypothetical protein [Oligoflexaceae bacterium]